MIRIKGLEFAYAESGFRLAVPSLSVEAGGRVAVIGASGCGKTTLLHLLAGILAPDSGSIRVADREVSALSDAQRRDFRIRNIGLVFQEFELLEYLDVLDNVLLPFRINRSLDLDESARARAKELATGVGLGEKFHRPVLRLSQGERQRVGLCRALVAGPSLILADEPTGNLDPDNKERALDILERYAGEQGATLVVATHDHALLPRFDSVIDFAELVA
ncbi:MAG: ABC transporter ATP-binding protein [Planctomycetota bacterium]|jgi:ABC-type lipoprotein export system ATPase subunit